MSSSRTHESIKSTLGRLVEVWCTEKGVEFRTLGSWTLKDELKKRGVEPDECYVLGDYAPNAPEPLAPDLAVEVVWTSAVSSFGGIDKLDVYRRLGVPEVWFWAHGRIVAYTLQGEHYVASEASVALPGIDLRLLARFIDRPRTSGAIREYREALNSTSK